MGGFVFVELPTLYRDTDEQQFEELGIAVNSELLRGVRTFNEEFIVGFNADIDNPSRSVIKDACDDTYLIDLPYAHLQAIFSTQRAIFTDKEKVIR